MAENYKGFAYTKESDKYKVVYGDTREAILDKLGSWNTAREAHMKYVYCNIGAYNPEMEKYINYKKYDVATGKNLSPLALKIPGVPKEEFQKITKEFKEQGAKFNSTYKKWYISPDNQNMEYFQQYLENKEEVLQAGTGQTERNKNDIENIKRQGLESQISLEQRYTQALQLAGYSRQPDLQDEMEWLAFRNEQTGQSIKADGWGLLGDKLETLKVPDISVKKQFEELIHPPEELIYYCISAKSLVQEVSVFNDFNEAVTAYLKEDPEDMQEMGVLTGGTKQELVHYSAADSQHHLRFAQQYTQLEEFMPVNQRVKLDYDNQQLNRIIEKENVYEKVSASLTDLNYMAMAAIKEEKEWETLSSRVANAHRPQDYIGLRLALDKETGQIEATAEVVRANELTDSHSCMIDTKDFRMGIEPSLYYEKEFTQRLKEGISRWDTDMEHPFTVYGTGLGKTLEEHYEKLNRAGYDALPNQRNYDKEEAENSEQEVSRAKQAESRKDYAPELVEQAHKIVSMDIQEMNIAQEKLSLLQGLVEKDIEVNGEVSNMTNYLLDAYNAEIRSVDTNGKSWVIYKQQEITTSETAVRKIPRQENPEKETQPEEEQAEVPSGYREGDRIDIYRAKMTVSPENTSKVLTYGISHVNGVVEEIIYDPADDLIYRVRENDTFITHVNQSEIYSDQQAGVLLRAEDDRLPPEKFDVVARHEFNSAQMEELRMAFKEGMGVEQVKRFADKALEAWQMDLCKYGMQHGLEMPELQEIYGVQGKDWLQCRKEVNGLITEKRRLRIKELETQGFTADEKMVKSMERLDHLTHRTNSLKDICNAFKEGSFKDSEAGEIVNYLGREFQQQEMQQQLMESVVPEL